MAFIQGTPGNDNGVDLPALQGTDLDDDILGGDGDDKLYGNGGDDHLNGESGNDYVDGGPGNDLLNGGDGDDVLYDNSGVISMYGGAGNDTLIVEHDASGGTVDGASGDDHFIIRASTGLYIIGNGGFDTFEIDLASTGNVLAPIQVSTETGVFKVVATSTQAIQGDLFALGAMRLIQDGINTIVQLRQDFITSGGTTIAGPFVNFATILSTDARSLTAYNFNGSQPIVHDLVQPARNDFDGDGRSDVLWKNDNGIITDWLGRYDGTFTGNAAKLSVQSTSTWHVVGTGDFDGDRRADVLFQNDDGTITDWLGRSDGTFTGNAAKFSMNLGTAWHVVGTGDFNGDSRVDMLLRNADGTVTDWLAQADGSFTSNAANFSTTLASAWHVVGTGDFNGDDYADVLFQNDDGTITNWLARADGSFSGNAANFSINPGAEWHVVGTGHFNGDANVDVILRSDSGVLAEWLGQGDGTFVANSDFQDAVPVDWKLVSVGDFNGTGIDDLLWQRSDGTTTDWLGQADGTFIGNGAQLSIVVASQWHLQDPMTHDPLL